MVNTNKSSDSNNNNNNNKYWFNSNRLIVYKRIKKIKIIIISFL
jgi:hypothetical protein